MKVISPSAKQRKRAAGPAQRRGPRAGVKTKVINIAPLDDADWLRLAQALGKRPSEFDDMMVGKAFPWRDGVDCVIKNAINFLEPVCSGPTASQLAARLRAISAETQKFLEFLLSRENIVPFYALADLEYSIGLVPEEYMAVKQLQRRSLAKARTVQIYINAFLCDAVTLTSAIKVDCALPTHGEEERADEFAAYRFTRALIDLAHLRAARVAPSVTAVWKTEKLRSTNLVRQGSCSET
jgi:hypothetical protein